MAELFDKVWSQEQERSASAVHSSGMRKTRKTSVGIAEMWFYSNAPSKSDVIWKVHCWDFLRSLCFCHQGAFRTHGKTAALRLLYHRCSVPSDDWLDQNANWSDLLLEARLPYLEIFVSLARSFPVFLYFPTSPFLSFFSVSSFSASLSFAGTPDCCERGRKTILSPFLNGELLSSLICESVIDCSTRR